jgi:release factor glutamine methyltransferase
VRARALLADAVARLDAAGVASPRVDAELLLAHSAAVSRSRLITMDEVPQDAATRFAALLERRAHREPLQHLIGTAPFRNLELAVGPGVFVPRPETELLVDAVLPSLTGLAAPLVVDLCSGSGALALAVADEVPASRVIAVELSERALDWLRRNATGTRVEVIAADVASPDLLPSERGRADAVLSNPPYVPAATPVAPEVRADPDEAVFAGADGLRLIPAVLERAADLLRSGGVLALEHDDTHAEAVPALLRAGDGWDRAWDDVREHADLSGRPRFVTARRR